MSTSPTLVDFLLHPTWNYPPDPSREGEQFTATTDCPRCRLMAIHWLEQPRHRPAWSDDSPLAVAQHRISDACEYMSVLHGGSMYDHPGASVIRVCRGCEYRWGQR